MYTQIFIVKSNLLKQRQIEPHCVVDRGVSNKVFATDERVLLTPISN